MFGTEVFQISPTVWCVRRRSYLTCSYILKRGDSAVLIDAGMASLGADVWQGLVAAGLEPNRVAAIYVTHWHNDHGGGIRAVQDRSGATVYAHPREIPYLTGETARSGVRGFISDRIPELGVLVLLKGFLGESAPRVVANPTPVEEGDTLPHELEVFETPGHTPGHLAYYYRSERVLFAGDALAAVNGRVALMARGVTPDLDQARKSALKLLALDVDIFCPGHRRPLSAPSFAELREFLEQGEAWPLLGVP